MITAQGIVAGIEIYSACDHGILLSNTIAYCCVSVGLILSN